jgi:type IV secretion system protein VirD4
MVDFARAWNAVFQRKAARDGMPSHPVGWLNSQTLTGPAWSTGDVSGTVNGIILGTQSGRSVSWNGEGHVLTVSGAAGDVGGSLLVPNLLAHKGSALVVDLGGDLARITAQARLEMGQTVVVLDPFGVSGVPTGRLNPLAALDPQSETVVDDAASLAEALIVGDTPDPHWSNSARLLVKGATLLTMTLPAEARTLVVLRRLLSGEDQLIADVARRFELDPADTAAALVALMRSCDQAFDGVVANIGMILAAMPERERANVFATARVQLEFLRSPALSPVLESSDVRFNDLHSAPTTIYVCLPVGRMATHGRWMRMLITLALAACDRARAKTDIPVLMVLNQFALLDPIGGLEIAISTPANSGVRLWLIAQSLAQLQARYPSGWQTMVGNAGVMTFCSNSDPATLDYMSERVGMGRPELQGLLARDASARLVLAAGQAPVVLQRLKSAGDGPSAGQFRR